VESVTVTAEFAVRLIQSARRCITYIVSMRCEKDFRSHCIISHSGLPSRRERTGLIMFLDLFLVCFFSLILLFVPSVTVTVTKR